MRNRKQLYQYMRNIITEFQRTFRMYTWFRISSRILCYFRLTAHSSFQNEWDSIKTLKISTIFMISSKQATFISLDMIKDVMLTFLHNVFIFPLSSFSSSFPSHNRDGNILGNLNPPPPIYHGFFLPRSKTFILTRNS